MPTMVYRSGDRYVLHGVSCETKIVEDVEAALADGWYSKPTDIPQDEPEMTGKELKEALEELGVESIPRKLEDRRALLESLTE